MLSSFFSDWRDATGSIWFDFNFFKLEDANMQTAFRFRRKPEESYKVGNHFFWVKVNACQYRIMWWSYPVISTRTSPTFHHPIYLFGWEGGIYYYFFSKKQEWISFVIINDVFFYHSHSCYEMHLKSIGFKVDCPMVNLDGLYPFDVISNALIW